MATASRSRAQGRTLERNIHFFRADAGLNAAGRPVALDVEPGLDLVSKAACQDGERYQPQGDDNVLSSWVDSTANRSRFRLATVRRAGLPLVEATGTLSSLQLAADQGLYEAIHAIFFPNNVVGVEFNFYGPRPSRIPWYLNRVTKGQCPTFTLNPLLRQDVVDQLNRLEQVRVLDLAIRPSYADTVAEADQDLGSAFRAAERAGGSQMVQLTLRPEPHARTWLRPRILDAIRQLAPRDDLRQNAQRFTVRGLNGERQSIEEIDVLRDQLIARRQVVRLDDRSRAVRDDAAYGAIEDAYAELRTDLERAAAAAAE